MNKLIIIGAILLALGGAHYYDKQIAIKEAVELTTGRLNAEWQKKIDESLDKKDKAQVALSNSHFIELESKNAKIQDINGKLNTALISLRSRPTRTESSSISPSNPEVAKTCTGKELAREDAEFLTGEAAESDQRVVDRDYYYGEYENLRTILEQLRK